VQPQAQQVQRNHPTKASTQSGYGSQQYAHASNDLLLSAKNCVYQYFGAVADAINP
jgi:hypothetical protein